MLLGAGRHRQTELLSGIDSIHNYYEKLVLDEVARTSERSRDDSEFLADVACVALNRLPPRYIRHNVDMTFFMSTQELGEINDKVQSAVREAIAYVTERENERLAEEGEYEAVETDAIETEIETDDEAAG
ncbi:MAG: late competence development ComFB family protein [Pseudomonadota bacterium]|nr:late competence development ComFB family protein [Pseudomonadota bacterium]